jgi:hypothetical protein
MAGSGISAIGSGTEASSVLAALRAAQIAPVAATKPVRPRFAVEDDAAAKAKSARQDQTQDATADGGSDKAASPFAFAATGQAPQAGADSGGSSTSAFVAQSLAQEGVPAPASVSSAQLTGAQAYGSAQNRAESQQTQDLAQILSGFPILSSGRALDLVL